MEVVSGNRDWGVCVGDWTALTRLWVPGWRGQPGRE
jgi:hypothetical protein